MQSARLVVGSDQRSEFSSCQEFRLQLCTSTPHHDEWMLSLSGLGCAGFPCTAPDANLIHKVSARQGVGLFVESAILT